MSSIFDPRRFGADYHQVSQMAEPASTGIAGLFGWKLLGLGALVGSGVLGAVVAAAFDPPADRKTMFKQFAVAGVGSLFFGPIGLRVIDQYLDWVNFATMGPTEFAEWAAPVFLLVGALSWGVFGAIAQFRRIVRDRAAEAFAARLGVPPAPPTDKPAV